MHVNKYLQKYLFLWCFVPSVLFSMEYDNRYLPLLQRPFSRMLARPSNLMFNLLVLTGDDAYTKDGETKVKEVSFSCGEFYGKYNQEKVGEALVAIGKTNPLPSPWRDEKIIWDSYQKITGFGVTVDWNQFLSRRWSVGASFAVMNIGSKALFTVNKEYLSLFPQPGDLAAIDRYRRQMNAELGIKGEEYSVTGISDLDLYIRWGLLADYILRCKRVDVGLKFGLIFPFGTKLDNDYPTSVPFDGQGHWGIYWGGEGEFELKEDFSVGGSFRFIARFAKTENRRMSVKGELPMYGGVTGAAYVDPSLTTALCVYLIFSNIRDGLGIQVRYTSMGHGTDSWIDKRSNKTIQTTLNAVENYSDWVSEYVSLNVFYDFGWLRERTAVAPLISFEWDIPTKMFAAKLSNRTQRVTLGVGFAY